MLKYFRIIIPILISLLLVSSSCITVVVNDDTENQGATDNADGLSEDEASAILFKFAVENELAVLQVLEIFSDGFTKPILEPGVQLSYDDYDTILNSMAALAEMDADVRAALDVLVSPEHAARSVLYASLIVLPNYAGSYPSGFVGSFLDFFGYMGGTGKRSSERIIKLTKNTTASQKKDMFESLPSAWRKGSTNADEWFAKLNSGYYNNKAAQIHKHFSTSFAGDYGAEAAAQGERPLDVAAKEGAQMVKKGAQFYIDAGTTIVNAGAPGFSDAVSNTQNVVTKVNQYEGYIKTAYKNGMGAALTQAAKDKLDGQVTGQLENTLGNNFSDAVMHFTGQVMGANKPSDLVGKVLGSGTVKVTGAGTASSGQVAIAFNQDDNAKTKMVATVTNTGEPELNVPQGKYIVVTSDTAGNKADETDVIVTAGQQTTVAMQPESSDDTVGNKQVATEEPKDNGKSFLDTARLLLDAALAGLKGDKNGDGTGNDGSSDTAATGNQNDTGGSGNAVPAPTPTPAQVTGCNWNGRWKTNHAGLTLTQNGSYVTGTYGLMGETMKGTASGNTFTGTWENPSSSASTNTGDIELTMSADCNSFTGRWRYNSAVFDLEWDGIWTGTRIDAAP
ncbi:MAG: hypothetical protein PVJ08_07655 [Dehalococcoidia bacterium]